MPRIRKESSIIGKPVFILVVVLLVTLIALGIYFNKFFERSYVAVHLTNGDTYFGQLYRFPKLQLGDVYVVQSMIDPNDSTKTVLQVVPLNLVAFWDPDKLELNRDQVVFIAKIGEKSQVMDVIRQSEGVTQEAQP